MTRDLALDQRRAWLHTLSRRCHADWRRDLADRLAGWMVPARRRARLLVRTTLVRL